MISGAKTGKTLSYIMALIDSVQDKSDYEDVSYLIILFVKFFSEVRFYFVCFSTSCHLVMDQWLSF